MAVTISGNPGCVGSNLLLVNKAAQFESVDCLGCVL